MMFLADLGRAFLTALIPISAWLDGPTLALIMLVTFPLNVLRVVAGGLEGIAFVVRDPTLRAVIALWATISVVYAGLTSALIFYITIDRGDGSDVVGVVLSAFAVGSLGGSLVAARMAFHAVGSVMLVGTVGIGISLVVLALDVPVAVLVRGALLAGILNANVLVSYLTLRTQLSPDALLGRVGATARTVSVGMMPIGALAAGALLDAIGGTATLALMGTASIAAGVGFALVPTVRQARVPRPVARS